MIKSFTQSDCKDLRVAVLEAIKPLEEKYGVAVETAGGTFSPTDYTMKLRFMVRTPNGEAVRPEAEAFKQRAEFYGLKKSDLGRKFRDGDWHYTIEGLALRRSRYPILCLRSDGKRFKYPVDMVKLRLEATKESK